MPGPGFGAARAARRRRGGPTVPVTTALPQTACIVARWSADAMPAQADNSDVTSWTDSVSNLTMAGAGATRPKYRVNQFDGKPGVQFTATSGHKLVLARASAGPINAATAARRYTVFIVHRQTGAIGGAAMLFSTGNGSVPLPLFSDGVEIGRNGIQENKILYASQAFTTLGYSSTDQYLSRTYVNGGCVGAINDIGPSGGSGDYAMGNDPDGNYPNNCILFDVIMWNRELTPVEMLQCEKWARDKYGLAYPWAGVSTFDVYHGDSITQGAGADRPYYSYPTYASATLGRGFGQWTNLGIGGATIAQLDARALYEVDGIAAMTGKPVRLAFGEFFNSAIEGGGFTNTAAQCAAQIGTYLANRRAAGVSKIALWTCTDSGGGTNQDIVRAKKAAFVAGLLGLSPSLYDVLVRVDQNASIGVDGAWANTTSFFTGDGIHLYGKAATPNDYSVLGGLVATGLASIG